MNFDGLANLDFESLLGLLSFLDFDGVSAGPELRRCERMMAMKSSFGGAGLAAGGASERTSGRVLETAGAEALSEGRGASATGGAFMLRETLLATRVTVLAIVLVMCRCP